MKLSLIATAVALGTTVLGVGAPASAAPYTVSVTGVLSSGYDETGHFGVGTDPSGQAVTFQETYNNPFAATPNTYRAFSP